MPGGSLSVWLWGARQLTVSLEVTHSVQMKWKSLGGDFQDNNNSQPLIIWLSTTAVTYLAKVLRLLDFIFGYIVNLLIQNTLFKSFNLTLMQALSALYMEQSMEYNEQTKVCISIQPLCLIWEFKKAPENSHYVLLGLVCINRYAIVLNSTFLSLFPSKMRPISFSSSSEDRMWHTIWIATDMYLYLSFPIIILKKVEKMLLLLISLSICAMKRHVGIGPENS